MWLQIKIGQRERDGIAMIESRDRQAVRRVDASTMAGVALEELPREGARTPAIGIYAHNWSTWYFLQERKNVDPMQDPAFYFNLARGIMRGKNIKEPLDG